MESCWTLSKAVNSVVKGTDSRSVESNVDTCSCFFHSSSLVVAELFTVDGCGDYHVLELMLS